MRLSSRSRFAAALAPAIVAIFLLAGCSGIPSPETTDGPAASTDSQGGDAGFETARDAYDLKLAQCLREAGFDVKDPKPGQGITETTEGINEAASGCMAEIGDPPRPEGKIDETEALKTMLEWAECLRGRGLDGEEPTLGAAFIMPADATDDDVAACIPAV